MEDACPRLQNNGGPLTGGGQAPLTHMLLNGSPALNAIPPAACFDLNAIPVQRDERGAPRPAGGACDIGAVEGSRSTSLLFTNLIRNGDAELAIGTPYTTSLLFSSTADTVPAGTRHIDVYVLFQRTTYVDKCTNIGTAGDNYNYGLADNISLVLRYPHNLYLPLVRR